MLRLREVLSSSATKGFLVAAIASLVVGVKSFR
jgi:hypothetical protein